MPTVDAPDGLIEKLRAAQALARLIGDAPTFRTALETLPAAARSEGVAASNAPLLARVEAGTF
jgi:hypothetical protein